MHDVPYLRGEVGPEIVAAMTAIAIEVKGGDAWMQATVDGTIVSGTGRVYKDGESATFTGKTITVRSGNAAATNITYNGVYQGTMGQQGQVRGEGLHRAVSVADLVGVLRAVATIPIAWAVLAGAREIALLLFIVAALSDALDQQLARRAGRPRSAWGVHRPHRRQDPGGRHARRPGCRGVRVAGHIACDLRRHPRGHRLVAPGTRARARHRVARGSAREVEDRGRDGRRRADHRRWTPLVRRRRDPGRACVRRRSAHAATLPAAS